MALTPREQELAKRIAKELRELKAARKNDQTAADWILEQTKQLSPEDKKKVKVELILPPRNPEIESEALPKPPNGMSAAQWQDAMSQHQDLRDAENIRLNRLCGGLEAPYLLSPAPQTLPKEIIPSENKNDGQSEEALNEDFINRIEYYTGSKTIKKNESLGRYAISALLIAAWIFFLLGPLNYGLPVLLIVILISLKLGSSEDRFLALISLFSLSIWLWVSLPVREQDMVRDAYASHRYMIGCNQTDKYLAISNEPSKKPKLAPPSKIEIERCTVDNPIDEDYRQYVLDMEERGWGKYQANND